MGVYRNRKVGIVARQLIPHCPSYLGDGRPKRIWMIPRPGRNSSPSLFPGPGERISSLSHDLPLVIWSPLQHEDAPSFFFTPGMTLLVDSPLPPPGCLCIYLGV